MPIEPVYHFTDTCRLPWIIESGALRPSTNFIGGFPKDFLWATTDAAGDRTASAGGPQQKVYRDGAVQLIRLTLPGDAFGDWREAVARRPEWTDEHVEMLLGMARRLRVDERKWRCRVDPLPMSAVMAAHAKSYRGGRWVPIEATREYCFRPFEGDDDLRGFVINGQAYCARRYSSESGATGYTDLMLMGVTRDGEGGLGTIH